MVRRAGPPSPGAIRGARAARLPATFELELATLVSEAPIDAGWVLEVKLDGYRLLARRERGGVRLLSRNGLDWSDRFPQLVEAVAALPCSTAVLDGEAVVLDGGGVSRFGELQRSQRRRRPDLFLVVFDLLYLDGYDLRGAALVERKAALRRLVATDAASAVRFSEHLEADVDAFLAQACRAGLEGIICKRADAPYRAGRSGDWLKLKCKNRQELIVVGYTDPAGARTGLGALLLAVRGPTGELRYAGKVGAGFTTRSLAEVAAALGPLARSSPPVADPPRGARSGSVHWVEPVLVAEIEFAEWTRDDLVRQGVFLGLRDDKPATSVVRETPRQRRSARR